MADDKRAELFPTLVYLADTLVTGFDVLDLADRLVETSIEVLGALAAGIMLDDQHGSLRVLASSDEQTRLLELMEVQNEEGPCLDAFRSGQTVAVHDLAEHTDRWPQFVTEAQRQSIDAAYAIPMRLRETTIGA